MKTGDVVCINDAPHYLSHGGEVVGFSKNGTVYLKFYVAMHPENVHPLVYAEKNVCCSFCTKARTEVAQLIVATGVTICNECVVVCGKLIIREVKKVSARTKKALK